MKKILCILFCFNITYGWQPINYRLFALNTHANFGKKHFIIGYTSYNKSTNESDTHINDPYNILDKSGIIKKTLFAPNDDIKKTLLYLIDQEQKNISIAMFAFTDKDFAHALTQAQQRGVRVEIIVDPSNMYGRYNKLTDLHNGNVAIFVYNPNRFNKKIPGIMHNKFALFSKNICNKSIIWTGSFNFTRAAYQRNQENVLILDDKDTISKFIKQFNEIKKYTDKYHLQK